MGARLKPHHQDDVRAKIKVGNIIDRLEKHINGDIELSATQVTSAKILLDKTVASLSSTELTGNSDKPLDMTATVRFVDAGPRNTGKS
jgi:hypothetical protein